MNDTNYKGYTLTIEQDEFAEDPRSWDNLGTMVCFHGRYTLGDKTGYKSDDFNSWQELWTTLVKSGKILIAPLYLYDHSGLRIKIGSFQGLLPQGHAEFDSGQIGFIYTTPDAVKNNYNVKRITKKIRQQAEELLANEVTTYDEFLSGSIYSVNITDEHGEFIDNLGGIHNYYEAEKQAKDMVDSYIKHNKPKARDKSILGRMHV